MLTSETKRRIDSCRDILVGINTPIAEVFRGNQRKTFEDVFRGILWSISEVLGYIRANVRLEPFEKVA